MNQRVLSTDNLEFFSSTAEKPVEWLISEGITDYETALSAMEARVQCIVAGEANECVWL